jgi:hypothetical protein
MYLLWLLARSLRRGSLLSDQDAQHRLLLILLTPNFNQAQVCVTNSPGRQFQMIEKEASDRQLTQEYKKQTE